MILFTEFKLLKGRVIPNGIAQILLKSIGGRLYGSIESLVML